MATKTRLTADERREQLVAAALDEFAIAGLAGASTEKIAKRAGISHAYLFRLYPTKRELFLAVCDRSSGHILATFERAYAERAPDEPVLEALGHAYVGLLADRRELLFQLHGYAAAGDDDIRLRVRENYLRVMRYVAEVSGAPEDEIRAFMATGLLLTVGAALDAPDLLVHDDDPC